MSLERLVLLLRCLECGDKLDREEKYLVCAGCRKIYPLRGDVPVMVKKDSEDELWEDYFHRISSRMGDTEAANLYFSQKNFRFVRKTLLELIGRVKGLTILDVGCGTGHFAEALTRDNLVFGVDISISMLGFARKKGLMVVHSSGKKLPFETGSFDLVIANNVIQSIRDGSVFVRELSRMVRPGGELLISATNGQNLSLGLLRLVEKRKDRHLEVYGVEDLTRFCVEGRCLVESVVFLFYPFGFVKKTARGSPVGLLERRLATTLAVLARKPDERRLDDEPSHF